MSISTDGLRVVSQSKDQNGGFKVVIDIFDSRLTHC